MRVFACRAAVVEILTVRGVGQHSAGSQLFAVSMAELRVFACRAAVVESLTVRVVGQNCAGSQLFAASMAELRVFACRAAVVEILTVRLTKTRLAKILGHLCRVRVSATPLSHGGCARVCLPCFCVARVVYTWRSSGCCA